MIMQPWTAGCQRGSGNERQKIRLSQVELGPGRGHFVSRKRPQRLMDRKNFALRAPKDLGLRPPRIRGPLLERSPPSLWRAASPPRAERHMWLHPASHTGIRMRQLLADAEFLAKRFDRDGLYIIDVSMSSEPYQLRPGGRRLRVCKVASCAGLRAWDGAAEPHRPLLSRRLCQ